MTTSAVMSRDVHVVPPTSTLEDAARLMKNKNVGFLPVVAQGSVLGVVTDRDLATRCLADGLPHVASVKEVMTSNTIKVREDDDLLSAMDTMTKNEVGRVLVVNRRDELVGVLSAIDAAVMSSDSLATARLLGSLRTTHRSEKIVAKA